MTDDCGRQLRHAMALLLIGFLAGVTASVCAELFSPKALPGAGAGLLLAVTVAVARWTFSD